MHVLVHIQLINESIFKWARPLTCMLRRGAQSVNLCSYLGVDTFYRSITKVPCRLSMASVILDITGGRFQHSEQPQLSRLHRVSRRVAQKTF